MRRVVIDTNVLIRAFLKNSGNDYLVFKLFLDGQIDLYYSQELVDEFMDVISRPRLMEKYHISKDTISLYWEDIFEFGKLKTPQKVNICRDTRDNHVIGLAMASGRGNHAYLVTADEDIWELRGKIKGVRVMKPKDFIKLYKHD